MIGGAYAAFDWLGQLLIIWNLGTTECRVKGNEK